MSKQKKTYWHDDPIEILSLVADVIRGSTPILDLDALIHYKKTGRYITGAVVPQNTATEGFLSTDMPKRNALINYPTIGIAISFLTRSIHPVVPCKAQDADFIVYISGKTQPGILHGALVICDIDKPLPDAKTFTGVVQHYKQN